MDHLNADGEMSQHQVDEDVHNTSSSVSQGDWYQHSQQQQQNNRRQHLDQQHSPPLYHSQRPSAAGAPSEKENAWTMEKEQLELQQQEYLRYQQEQEQEQHQYSVYQQQQQQQQQQQDAPSRYSGASTISRSSASTNSTSYFQTHSRPQRLSDDGLSMSDMNVLHENSGGDVDDTPSSPSFQTYNRSARSLQNIEETMASNTADDVDITHMGRHSPKSATPVWLSSQPTVHHQSPTSHHGIQSPMHGNRFPPRISSLSSSPPRVVASPARNARMTRSLQNLEAAVLEKAGSATTKHPQSQQNSSTESPSTSSLHHKHARSLRNLEHAVLEKASGDDHTSMAAAGRITASPSHNLQSPGSANQPLQNDNIAESPAKHSSLHHRHARSLRNLEHAVLEKASCDGYTPTNDAERITASPFHNLHSQGSTNQPLQNNNIADSPANKSSLHNSYARSLRNLEHAVLEKAAGDGGDNRAKSLSHSHPNLHSPRSIRNLETAVSQKVAATVANNSDDEVAPQPFHQKMPSHLDEDHPLHSQFRSLHRLETEISNKTAASNYPPAAAAAAATNQDLEGAQTMATMEMDLMRKSYGVRSSTSSHPPPEDAAAETLQQEPAGDVLPELPGAFAVIGGRAVPRNKPSITSATLPPSIAMAQQPLHDSDANANQMMLETPTMNVSLRFQPPSPPEMIERASLPPSQRRAIPQASSRQNTTISSSFQAEPSSPSSSESSLQNGQATSPLHTTAGEGVNLNDTNNSGDGDDVSPFTPWTRSKQWRRIWTIVMAVLLLFMILMVIMIVVLSSRNNKHNSAAGGVAMTMLPTPPATDEPTMAPTSLGRLQEFESIIAAKVYQSSKIDSFPGLTTDFSSYEQMQDALSNTPQFKALEWISNFDEAALDPLDDQIRERYILAVLYYATGGPTTWETDAAQGAFVPFLTPSSICDWNVQSQGKAYGILCATAGDAEVNRIQSIEFPPNFGLVGFIPPEIGYLKHLKTLIIRSSKLAFIIPSSLGELSTLENLSLEANQLEGTFPIELTNATNLIQLNLAVNSLSGPMPSEFGRLTNLRSLNFLDNVLSGAIPTELGRLSQLTGLDLARNSLSESIPTEVGKLVYLELLHLSQNNLIGSIPANIASCSLLKAFVVDGNQLTGQLPSELGQLISLELLKLEGNDFNGTVPDLRSLENATVVKLENNDNLSGDLDRSFCWEGRQLLEAFTADCDRVTCTCCTRCYRT